MGKKFLKMVLISLTLFAAISGTAIAATTTTTVKKKKISTVSFKVSGSIKVDTPIGTEDLDFTTSASKYYIDSTEEENEGFTWSMEDVPQYKVTLQAEDGYEFNVKKASDINITGATYVSANSENSRTTLIVKIKLPALKNQIAPITESNLNKDGNLTWSSVLGAGSYEVKFYRGQSLLGGIQKSSSTSINLREYMQKAGNYHFLVRPINQSNPDIAGEWFESNRVTIDEQEAQENKNWYENINLGTWGETASGEWYYILPDNTLARKEWKRIKDEWYYFGDDGYMVKGWLQDGDKWYYLDPNDGRMWKNTTTEDGYELAIDGSMATGNSINK